MKIKKYKLIILAFCWVTLSSCNVIDNNQSARIKTKINDLKISNNLRSYSECVEDGKSFDNLASNENSEAENINLIRESLQEKMRDCLWLPDFSENYPQQKKCINRWD